jgi:hypothetical protein
MRAAMNNKICKKHKVVKAANIWVYLRVSGRVNYLYKYHNIAIIVYGFAIVEAQLEGPEKRVD